MSRRIVERRAPQIGMAAAARDQEMTMLRPAAAATQLIASKPETPAVASRHWPSTAARPTAPLPSRTTGRAIRPAPHWAYSQLHVPVRPRAQDCLPDKTPA